MLSKWLEDKNLNKNANPATDNYLWPDLGKFGKFIRA